MTASPRLPISTPSTTSSKLDAFSSGTSMVFGKMPSHHPHVMVAAMALPCLSILQLKTREFLVALHALAVVYNTRPCTVFCCSSEAASMAGDATVKLQLHISHSMHAVSWTSVFIAAVAGTLSSGGSDGFCKQGFIYLIQCSTKVREVQALGCCQSNIQLLRVLWPQPDWTWSFGLLDYDEYFILSYIMFCKAIFSEFADGAELILTLHGSGSYYNLWMDRNTHAHSKTEQVIKCSKFCQPWSFHNNMQFQYYYKYASVWVCWCDAVFTLPNSSVVIILSIFQNLTGPVHENCRHKGRQLVKKKAFATSTLIQPFLETTSSAQIFYINTFQNGACEAIVKCVVVNGSVVAAGEQLWADNFLIQDKTTSTPGAVFWADLSCISICATNTAGCTFISDPSGQVVIFGRLKSSCTSLMCHCELTFEEISAQCTSLRASRV